ncbi:PilL N-terminal domain-containing protein [Pseudomonas borbori]|uniref:Type IV pili sensor histidine kinase and response regulator n=1 Tax=Pseudomonas borbori TaxID=289003 RepID=A0A1I5WJR1_9PSED|nr:PilL N-terminal domain-containing protein [Pseudomonas borbori]SFQ19788.1 type IV pili sensor histidine kinase and response regulator [Pseudomonas borbori]
MYPSSVLLALLALLGACTSQVPAVTEPRDRKAGNEHTSGASPLPVQSIRYGRYTLVSTEPSAEQRDLLAQIIDVSIPPALNPTVQDAMRHVLQRSGYSLCPINARLKVLFTRPLPAVHYRLGPLALRNALEVLAGPAWQLLADDVGRAVCFRQLSLDNGSASPATPLQPEARP